MVLQPFKSENCEAKFSANLCGTGATLPSPELAGLDRGSDAIWDANSSTLMIFDEILFKAVKVKINKRIGSVSQNNAYWQSYRLKRQEKTLKKFARVSVIVSH